MINQIGFWNSLFGDSLGQNTPLNPSQPVALAGWPDQPNNQLGKAVSLGSANSSPAGGGFRLRWPGEAGNGLRLGGAAPNGAGFVPQTEQWPTNQAPSVWETLSNSGKDLLTGFDELAAKGSKALEMADDAKGLLADGDFQAPPMTPVDQSGNVFDGLLSPTDQVDLSRRLRHQQNAVFGLLGGYSEMSKTNR